MAKTNRHRLNGSTLTTEFSACRPLPVCRGFVKVPRINVEAGMRETQRVRPARCAVDVSPGIECVGTDDGVTQKATLAPKALGA